MKIKSYSILLVLVLLGFGVQAQNSSVKLSKDVNSSRLEKLTPNPNVPKVNKVTKSKPATEINQQAVRTVISDKRQIFRDRNTPKIVEIKLAPQPKKFTLEEIGKLRSGNVQPGLSKTK